MIITSTYEDTTANLTFFANSKGWIGTFTNPVPQEEGDENYQAVTDNPITLEMFLNTWATNLMVEQISYPMTEYARQQAGIAVAQQVALITADITSKVEVRTE